MTTIFTGEPNGMPPRPGITINTNAAPTVHLAMTKQDVLAAVKLLQEYAKTMPDTIEKTKIMRGG